MKPEVSQSVASPFGVFQLAIVVASLLAVLLITQLVDERCQ